MLTIVGDTHGVHCLEGHWACYALGWSPLWIVEIALLAGREILMGKRATCKIQT